MPAPAGHLTGEHVYESQFEQKLYNERREKLNQIAELGAKSGLSRAAATYPNHYDASHTVPQLRAEFDPVTAEQFAADLEAGKKAEVSIAGRVMAIRVQGKAGFAQLQQGGQRIQIYVRKDDVGEDAFALYKLLDLGDHIGVHGYMMRTRTGELTIHVSALTFLAKAMLALPDKFHGLEDTELRYRQRYLDLIMNSGNSPKPTGVSFPVSEVSSRTLSEAKGEGSASPAPPTPEYVPEAPLSVREVFVKRAAILRAMRRFFDERGYLEVETPMMHTIAGGAAAKPFTTHHNALDIDLKLRIAPELYLKRLVVGGFDRVYEINRNFRNEGISTQHNPEFTMLEFYQAYSNYHDLMELTKELIAYVAMEVNGTTKTIFNGIEIDLAPEKWQQLSMREAIIKFWPSSKYGNPPKHEDFTSGTAFSDFLKIASESLSPINLLPMLVSEVHRIRDTSSPEYFERALSASFLIHIRQEADINYGKAIAELFEAVAEPHLQQPTIIYDFPLAVSPLSKVKPGEPDWVERFEFYIGGFEVGNAFSELNDPDDQLRRFEAQIEERKRGDDEAMAEVDADYVRALGYGLPPTAGEGIGIDRLTMILTGSKSIRDVILFPLMRPQAKTEKESPVE